MPPPMRWQLCANCNDIIYVIVSPDECPKCGRPIIVRSTATLQTTMCTMPRFQHSGMLRPPATLHVTTPAIARPDVPKPLLGLMLERDIVSMIRRSRGTDNCITGHLKNQEAKWKAAHYQSHSWTAEEWKEWRREKGYRAWTGQISGECAST